MSETMKRLCLKQYIVLEEICILEIERVIEIISLYNIKTYSLSLEK